MNFSFYLSVINHKYIVRLVKTGNFGRNLYVTKTEAPSIMKYVKHTINKTPKTKTENAIG